MVDRPLRPRYHFCRENWINDPIPFWHDGTWHVFYQLNPKAPRWDRMHWGHAVSRDLVTWEHLPVALLPSESYDEVGGIWTGSVVRADGRFFAFYTGVSDLTNLRQVQCVAVSHDLVTWEKSGLNPLLVAPPQGFGPCWRDPHVWHDGRVWKMLIGSEREGVGGALLLYESLDLREWAYVGVALEGVADQTGHDFECPDLFPLGDRWVLLTSRGATHWQVGHWDGVRFTPDRRGTCDGPPFDPTHPDQTPFYAGKTAQDGHGRRLLFGWLRETEEIERRTWSGAHAIPRELSLDAHGDLALRWPTELNRTRQDHTRTDPIRVPPRERRTIPIACGAWGQFTLRTDGTSSFDLTVRADAAGNGTVLRYDAASRTFDGAPVGAGDLRIHALLDGSVLEFNINGRAMTSRRTYAPESHTSIFVQSLARKVDLDWIHSWHA